MLNALILCAALALVLGFGGRWAQPLDTLSHFRAHLAAGLLVLSALALLLGHWASGLAGALVAGVALYSTLPYLLPMRDPAPDGAPTYTLLQMNLLWNAGDHAEAIRRIADARPDIVTLQELTGDWRESLAPLEAMYPFQAVCLEADGFHGDSAILSRRPFVEGSKPLCNVGDSLAAARIDLNGVAVTVASHHQLWPWPRGQWRRLASVRDTLAQLPAPLILAGDFNAVGWSAFLQTYAETTGTRVVPGIGPTWMLEALPGEVARYVGVGIDNLLVSPTVTIHGIERPAATDSDHLPVLVRFSVTPPDDAPQTAVAARG
ncbi:endonuclease/exonuclease/phosphatase family protein [Aureimonas sp. SK2]|uniref:endonuclease/exonuclease/phosphatase family protein n=1 Tax=Aureimonas sp. SK2 TaxID=3015992 RepID=UPI002444E846|nr:endonuclease/exonuclease/phosphatase family protein [Aureimonas sp. SK2]